MSDADQPLLAESSPESCALRNDVFLPNSRTQSYKSWNTSRNSFFVVCSISIIATMLFFLSLMTAVGLGDAAALDRKQASSTVPDYFQTSPEVLPGPTKTADIAPFLAQTNPVPFGTVSYSPNQPLETAVPIQGNTNNSNIFQGMGQLSPYFPNPVGFGVGEYSVPPGANITHVQLLHRHGARYPTGDSSVASFGSKIRNLTLNGTEWTDQLSFLNTWKYTLGAEILVREGWKELFDSGVLFYYNYGHLYNSSGKFIARTTSQDRMLKSAQFFMTGFFGLEWPLNVTLEPILEQNGLNNSLAGYYKCNNSNNFRSTGGTNASIVWENIYLKEATERLRKASGNYEWNVSDSYNAQTLCPYETVAYGYSSWCDLFTYEEWQGFEYSIDLQFQGNNGFLSPTGRGVGIGWVEEFYARLQGHLYDLPPGATNVNRTLDTMESTFPLNQSLYFDFSHDTNIYSVITALGLTQFADNLPNDTMPADRNVTVSHITPFAARMVWELIQAPQPLKEQRPSSSNASMSEYYDDGPSTSYLHLMIGQRTVPLGASWSSCGNRDDGWCELSTAMDVLAGLLDTARYEYSCFGNYTNAPYGEVTDGVPITKRGLPGGFWTGAELEMSSDEAMYRI